MRRNEISESRSPNVLGNGIPTTFESGRVDERRNGPPRRPSSKIRPEIHHNGGSLRHGKVQQTVRGRPKGPLLQNHGNPHEIAVEGREEDLHLRRGPRTETQRTTEEAARKDGGTTGGRTISFGGVEEDRSEEEGAREEDSGLAETYKSGG